MLNIIKINDSMLVKLKGDLDHHCAEQIRQEIDDEIINFRPTKMIFDFADVTFMDSSGIGIVIGRYIKLEEYGGKLSLIGINKKIDKLVAVSGILKVVPVFDSLDEAIKEGA